MNLDELDNSAADSDSGHSVDSESKTTRLQQPLKEGPHLSSVPLDPEWVSPFTLPPLPALRKNRGQSHLLRSPEERLHQRSSSSAYYAAAWGSPYATPSPNRSPRHPRSSQRSQDFEAASPLSSKKRGSKFGKTALRESSRASDQDQPIAVSARRRASSWDRTKTLSERFNWLSESDLSGSEPDIAIERTPTRDTYLKDLKASVDKVKVPRSRPHQVQESVATVTPETFNAGDSSLASYTDGTEVPQVTMEQSTGSIVEARPSSGGMDKPLPNLPALKTNENMVNTAPTTGSPDSPSRPRMQSIQSFQRPKRKVPWKGKTCIIALPLVDRESAGLPPLLSIEEIRQRIRKWSAQSYDIVRLTAAGPQDISSGFGQSRPLFPDPSDMRAERKLGKLHVQIPDQGEWEAWVEYLKEEKLRALGVTPSNSEPPMSVQSPFSSTLSRVSSTYPSIAASPPIGTPSVNGNQVRIASNPFSPPLGHPNGMNSRGGSHAASPSISGYPGSMHGYKQSIAQQRMTSPYDYPVSHPGSFGPGMRSTSNGYGVRQFSPSHVANLQSLGQVLSPMVPTIPSNDNGRGTSQNPTMEQIRQQQQRQQQLHQHMMQHQRQYSYLPPPQSKSADQLPRTPISESPSRRTPEIMHPTPRSHRHNLSAALQKGIDDAEAARSHVQPPIDKRNEEGTKAQAEEQDTTEHEVEEDLEPELPVLKRPEILDNVDDQSEIETNPSIAASPMLVDDNNPFAKPFTNMQQIKDVLQPQSQHQPKPSMSKLNVDAPVFDPAARFASSSFAFSGQAFQPLPNTKPVTEKPLIGGSRPAFPPKNMSVSKFNVEAPAFTPSFLAESTPTKEPTLAKHTPARPSLDTPSKSSFTFGSPSFNVDAPEFKPGQPFSFTTSVQSFGEDQQPSFTSAGTIFGNVTIDPNSKVNRRGGKSVPIIRPQSSESESASDDESEDQSDSESTNDEIEQADDDDEGRVKAPSDRQKRARRVSAGDDEQLLFASSAPFDHADGLSDRKSQPVDEPDIAPQPFEAAKNDDETTTDTLESKSLEQAEEARQASDSDSKADKGENVAPPVTADTTSTKETPAPTQDVDLVESVVESVAEPVSIQSLSPPTVKVKESDDEHSSAVPMPAQVPVPASGEADNTTLTEGADKVIEKEGIAELKPDEPRLEPVLHQSGLQDLETQGGHQPKFSLSALAKPFEFRPGMGTSSVPNALAPSQPQMEMKPNRGLMASRFATISPEPEPDTITESREHASPPQKLYEHTEPEHTEHTSTDQSVTNRVAPDELPSMLQSPKIQYDATPQLDKSIEESMRRAVSRSLSDDSMVEETMPSYEEIDAVMKQFENNPDLGVERDDTPVKSTPLIDMRFPPVFRSDAPSPSPGRRATSPSKRPDWGLGIHKLNDGHEEVSDWNDEFSPRQEHKLESQAHYLDHRVNDLVGGALETRLGPLEQTLQTIQSSLITLLGKGAREEPRRKLSSDNRENSDADDEDDYGPSEGFSTYRSSSPSRNQRKSDRIRAAVMDAMAAYQPPPVQQPAIDMSEIHAALAEMRQLAQTNTQKLPQEPPATRAVIEEVISTHPHFKSIKVQEDITTIQESHRLEIEALRSLLKDAEKRADQELGLRQAVDQDREKLSQQLSEAQAEVAMQREVSMRAQADVEIFKKEQQAYKTLEGKHVSVLDTNKALEDTLAEYRKTSDQFRNDISLERARNKDLIRRMHGLREELNEKIESRQALRNQLDGLQDKMAQVMHDVHAEADEWRRKDHELSVKNKTIEAALDHEVRHREKLELEFDTLEKEHKENMRFKLQHEQAIQDISRLQEHVSRLNEENKAHQDKVFKVDRELVYAKESTEGEVSKATARMQSELEAARTTIESLQSDADAQISRLQKRLDDAELDLEEQKAKYDSAMAETQEAHSQTLHEANQKHESALEEQHLSHERKLNDLRERHTRALHNSSDDRHRLEYQLNEKLSFNEERTKHLESQVKDLEERLEISKSAARAAVEAATAKAANIPTPASSVVASPPQRLSSASLQLIKGSDIPERISPQAMRESIMVLQDQLQSREQTIENLEAEIATLDKEAPAKIKDRDNEISLLRELISVRVDDLDEIISTLAQPDFDRQATKNAAIRLKANLQMEQQLKEHAAITTGLASSLPSISTISNIAQSPRALPMAAAAAWGNWRKARDFGFNAVSDIASNISQTPSKSSPGSPSNFLAGIMTPPSTSQRTPLPSDSNPLSPPTMRPLAAAAAARKTGTVASEARPLRSYSTQARTLSSRQVEKRRESTESSSSETNKRPTQPQSDSPITPTISRNAKPLDFGEDVDEDASPFNTSDHGNEDAERTTLSVVTG